MAEQYRVARERSDRSVKFAKRIGGLRGMAMLAPQRKPILCLDGEDEDNARRIENRDIFGY